MRQLLEDIGAGCAGVEGLRRACRATHRRRNIGCLPSSRCDERGREQAAVKITAEIGRCWSAVRSNLEITSANFPYRVASITSSYGLAKSRSIRVADVQNTLGVSLHMDRFVHRTCKKMRAWVGALIVKLGNALDVVSCFREMGNSRVAGHCRRPRVIGRQRQLDVATIIFH